jgi:hypothetical protein
MYVSHETIYKSLFVQARGVLRKELIAHLRSRRTMRRAKTASTAGQARGQIRDAVSIRERPAEVEDRAVPGHWEGDLITGSHNSHIATLVERHSRYLLLVRVPGKDTASVVSALALNRLGFVAGFMLVAALVGVSLVERSRWLRTLRVGCSRGRCAVVCCCTSRPSPEDVPSSVELRWRPGDDQAALTVSS